MLAKRDVIQVRNEPRAREANEAHQKAALQRQIGFLDMKLKEVEGEPASIRTYHTLAKSTKYKELGRKPDAMHGSEGLSS